MSVVSPAAGRATGAEFRRVLRAAMPFVSLIVVLGAIFYLQPRTMSYFGLDLLLRLAVPLAFATLAQMFIMTVNDLDLSIGMFVGVTAGIGATILVEQPILGILALAGCVVAYGALGALIHLRRLPSIVVTLGMSFVWLGIAITLLPTPGGEAPEWLRTFITLKPPVVPLAIILLALIAAVAHVGLMWSPYGAILRGLGGNARAVERAGWSLLKAKVTMYSLAGLCGVLAGLTLLGLSGAADARFGERYTLLSIAAVILGGGEFVGGRVSPIGAVVGATTIWLAANSLLSALKLPPEWQIGAIGVILIAVLALRWLVERVGRS
jgi:ribose transport system permease protein